MKIGDMTSLPRNILAAGAAHIDRRGRASASYRPASSNPGRTEEAVGGAVFNAAVALRMWDAEVTLVSARGGDLAGDAVAQTLEAEGIRDLGITWLDRRTPSYTAILDDRGELVAGIADMELYDLLGARALSRRHIREAIARSDALLLDANLPPGGIAHLLQAFRERPVAAIGVSPAKVVKLRPHLPELSVVFLSRGEAAGLVEAPGGAGCGTLARLLFERGARRAVVTDGALDAAVLDAGDVFLQAPPPVSDVRDVTGAGDTLAAVAGLAFLQGEAFLESVRLGMAAASRLISAAPEPGQDLAVIRRIALEMPSPRRAGPTELSSGL